MNDRDIALQARNKVLTFLPLNILRTESAGFEAWVFSSVFAANHQTWNKIDDSIVRLGWRNPCLHRLQLGCERS
jgi:hypothetical protein